MPKTDALFNLAWFTELDELDNSVHEAASPCHADGAPFFFRIKRQLRGNRVEFYEASDAEVMKDEESPRTWRTLGAAKRALQMDADDIVRADSEK